MKKHAVAPVRDRNIVVVDPVWIDAHSRQCVIMSGKKLLQHIKKKKKTNLGQLQILRPPQRELDIIIGTVKGERIARYRIRRQDHLALVIPLLGHKAADIAFGRQAAYLSGRHIRSVCRTGGSGELPERYQLSVAEIQ